MKITVIELLNKMASDEEVPTKIKYNYITWEWNEKQKDYIELNGATRNLFTYYLDNLTECLNYKVEIIEEEKKIELPEKIEQIVTKYGKLHDFENVKEELSNLAVAIDNLILNQNVTLDYLKYKEEESKK